MMINPFVTIHKTPGQSASAERNCSPTWFAAFSGPVKLLAGAIATRHGPHGDRVFLDLSVLTDGSPGRIVGGRFNVIVPTAFAGVNYFDEHP